MKRIYSLVLSTCLVLGITLAARAQQKIGNNLGTLNPGAVLELESTNRGFLPSRVALTGSNAWSLNGTATDGMMVYNTATVTGANAITPGFYMWQAGSWVRIVTGTISTTNALTYAPTTRTLTSNVNGVASDAILPLATGSVTGLLSSTDFTTFNNKENPLTFSNGLTRTANAITLGGALTGNTALTLAANNFTFGGATTGKVIVSGPAGSTTSGLQLSNLLTAVTPNAAVANQRVLTVDANGNVILGTDFGTNNAGTVTNVSGTAPINVATGTTTPVISINALGITTGLLADNAVTTPKIADGAVTTAKIAPGTNGQYLTTVGGVTTWAALPAATVTGAVNGTSLVAGNVELGGALTKPTVITTTATNTLSFAGLTAKTVQVDNNDSLLVVNAQGRVQYLAVSNLPANNIYNADGSLTGNRTATLGANNLTFNASGAGQVIVSGPVGNTAGLRLSNLTGAGTAGTVGQKVLSVNASGDVVLVTDFGTNNAGTVTNVSGTAPINVATGTTTPVISINALGITTGLLADNAVTTPKIADGAITAAKLNPMGATAGQVLTWNGTDWAPTTSTFNNIYNIDGTLTGNRTVNKSTNNLTFTGSGNTVFNGGNVINIADNSAFIWDQGGNRTLGFVKKSGFQPNISAGQSAPIIFSTTPSRLDSVATATFTERMRIDANGNVGIGTASTAPARLQISAPLAQNGTIFRLLTTDGATTPRRIDVFPSMNGAAFNSTVSTGDYGIVFSNDNDPNINTNGLVITPHSLVPAGIKLMENGNVGIRVANPTSSMHVLGSVANSILRITAATTLNENHHTIIANAFTAGYAITLPAPSTCEGRIYVIRKVDESSNAITFTFTGITGSNAIRVSDTSATVGSYINSLNYTKTLRIQSDGTDWYLID